jgi:osmotically-inducible protein OsmY
MIEQIRSDIMPRVEEGIKQDVVDQLAWDDRVNAADVHVEVRDGTVVLQGEVPNYWAKIAAVEDAELVRGVRRVDDRLNIRWAPAYTPSDAELRDEVDRALRGDPNIDTTRTSIGVSDGVVSLDGTVDGLWKKCHAQRVASGVTGVVGIDNRLAVVPTGKFSDEAIASGVVAALKRNVLVDAERVGVRVCDGVVTLSGSVSSSRARRAAKDAALHTAGVLDVHDDLLVTV